MGATNDGATKESRSIHEGSREIMRKSQSIPATLVYVKLDYHNKKNYREMWKEQEEEEEEEEEALSFISSYSRAPGKQPQTMINTAPYM